MSPFIVVVAVEGVGLVVAGLAAERSGIASAESVFRISETLTRSVELHQFDRKLLLCFLENFHQISDLKSK